METARQDLVFLCSQFEREELLTRKYRFYSLLFRDPQLKSKCTEAAADHANHCQSLLKLLSE